MITSQINSILSLSGAVFLQPFKLYSDLNFPEQQDWADEHLCDMDSHYSSTPQQH